MNSGGTNGNKTSGRAQTLSIVLPCFEEEPNLRAVVAAILDVGLQATYQLEIILVDDGSGDGTWREISAIAHEESCVRGVRLSRNFGHQAALLAGMTAATGDAVVTMDADLQHPPSLLPEIVKLWQDGAEIVTTTRLEGRKWTVKKRFTSWLFYKTFQRLTGLPLQPGQADYRLFNRKVMDTLLSFRESGVFLRGLVSWVGFRQENVSYVADPRHAGRSKYTVKKMVQLGVDGMFSFSYLPLRSGLVLGGGMLFPSLLYAIYAACVGLIAPSCAGDLLPAWASWGAFLLFLFGLLFAEIGLIGEYLARVYIESKGRPQYIVAEQC